MTIDTLFLMFKATPWDLRGFQRLSTNKH